MKTATIYLFDGHSEAEVEKFDFTKVTELHKRLREHQKPYFQDSEIGTISEGLTNSGTPFCECWSSFTNYSHIASIKEKP